MSQIPYKVLRFSHSSVKRVKHVLKQVKLMIWNNLIYAWLLFHICLRGIEHYLK